MIHEALTIARGGMFMPHEVTPVGVPKDYDWYARPQLRAKRVLLAEPFIHHYAGWEV